MRRYDKDSAKLLLDIMANRRDVRGDSFIEGSIGDDELDMILQAGLYAPSVGYSQPWKFIIIEDEATKSFVYHNFKKSFKKSKKRFKHRKEYAKLKLEALQEAPLHIAVFYHNSGGDILGQTSQNDVGRYSIATAIENMWLMARALNIGLGWVSILESKKIRKRLNLGSAYELVGYLCLGRVDKFLDKPQLQINGWEYQKSRQESIIYDSKNRGSSRDISTIIGDKSYLDDFIDKEADFMLLMSYAKSSKIKGISQAGIKNKMYLTPTLDAEFIKTGKLKSLKKLPKTSKGVPTPATITRAIEVLSPFKDMKFVSLGLPKNPQIGSKSLRYYDIPATKRLDKGADFDALGIFNLGVSYAKEFKVKGEYLIISESIPSGTTSALASALALGYDADGLFSSSFSKNPNKIKEKIIEKALKMASCYDDLFDKLSVVSDNMLLFCAGFVLEVNSKYPIVLAGGTQMASVLLIINSISRYMGVDFDSSKLSLWTTKWIVKDKNSDIKALLQMVDFPINAFYSDFDFSYSNYPSLKKYDKGEAKEGVGAGGALIYGYLNGLHKREITKQIEGFIK